ncbi:MAG TPA: hypothetical protein GX704_01045 [Clostridiales bacterium]|nr:hypothetical protein [Clostridiales bacterium]
MKNTFSLTIRSILSFILAAALLAGVLASCGGDSKPAPGGAGADGANLAAEPEVEKLYLDDLPEREDLGGYKVRLLTSDKRSFEALEDAIDVTDVEVYKRQLLVEERFNVVIDTIIDDNWGTNATTLKNSVLAGSDDYDIYACYGYWSIGLATEGIMMNLKTAPNLNLDNPYWGAKFNDAMAYKDYMYWITGDIALSYTDGIYATYVNLMKFASKYSGENIYQIVKDGKWTLDNLFAYADGAYEDLNGDGKENQGDFFGYSYSKEDMIDGMSMAAGVKYTTRDADGVPQLYITKDNTAVTFAEKLAKIGTSKATFLANSDDGASMAKLFSDGLALFIVGRINYAATKMRDMQDDFAIIPAPKLNEEQSTYLTTLHDGTTLIGLPKTISDQGLNVSTYVLEAMAAESSRSLTPVYLDVALKNKYTRDADSADMIDLIRENIISDFGFLYTETGMNNFFRSYVVKGEGISSIIAKSEKMWSKTLDKIITNLEANAG